MKLPKISPTTKVVVGAAAAVVAASVAGPVSLVAKLVGIFAGAL